MRNIISFIRPDNPQLQEAFDTVYEVKIREKYQPQDIKIFLGFAVKKDTQASLPYWSYPRHWMDSEYRLLLKAELPHHTS